MITYPLKQSHYKYIYNNIFFSNTQKYIVPEAKMCHFPNGGKSSAKVWLFNRTIYKKEGTHGDDSISYTVYYYCAVRALYLLHHNPEKKGLLRKEGRKVCSLSSQGCKGGRIGSLSEGTLLAAAADKKLRFFCYGMFGYSGRICKHVPAFMGGGRMCHTCYIHYFQVGIGDKNLSLFFYFFAYLSAASKVPS